KVFAAHQGAIFICGANKILTLGKLGSSMEVSRLQTALLKAIPDYECNISIGAVTREGLETIAIRLREVVQIHSAAETRDFLALRQKRAERVFFVIDDDMFMRSLMVKTLKPFGRVIELTDTKGVVEAYMREVPDVVFI